MVARIRNALLLVLAIALGLRLAYALVRPVLSLLIVLFALIVVYSLLFIRRQ